MMNTEPKRVKVTVDGREIAVLSEVTILQALLQEKIHVPHLCYDIRLARANGNCGLCVVELGDKERDVKACQTPIIEGMVITTMSPSLSAYRKVRLEQLLSDHNADCVAPCVTTCPANIDIQSYLSQVANGNYEAALRVRTEQELPQDWAGTQNNLGTVAVGINVSITYMKSISDNRNLLFKYRFAGIHIAII